MNRKLTTKRAFLITSFLKLSLQHPTLLLRLRFYPPTITFPQRFLLKSNSTSTPPLKNKPLKLKHYSKTFRAVLRFPPTLYMISIVIPMPTSIIETKTASSPLILLIISMILVPTLNGKIQNDQQLIHMMITLIIILIIRKIEFLVLHKVSSFILTPLQHSGTLNICYVIARKKTSPTPPLPFQYLMGPHHAFCPTFPFPIMSRITHYT